MPIKDLYNEGLEFEGYLKLMVKEAESERRRLERRQYHRASFMGTM